MMAYLVVAEVSWEQTVAADYQYADETSAVMPVSMVQPEYRSMKGWVHGEGTAKAVRRVALRFEVPGRIAWLGTRPDGQPLREGDRVTGPTRDAPAGQTLLALDDRDYRLEVAQTEAALHRARKAVQVANADLKKSEAEARFNRAQLNRKLQLIKKGSVAQQSVDQAKANRDIAEAGLRTAKLRIDEAIAMARTAKAQHEQAVNRLNKTRLHAPWDGVVARINARVGRYVDPAGFAAQSTEERIRRLPIALIDPSTLEIELEIPVHDGLLVTVGQKAKVRSYYRRPDTPSADPGGWIDATVYSVSPMLSPGARSVRIKLRTADTDPGLRDGELVIAQVLTIEKRRSLAVPERALLFRANEAHVFTVDAGTGMVTRRKVRTGLRDGTFVEIAGGEVDETSIVVTDGRQRLSDGAYVTIATPR